MPSSVEAPPDAELLAFSTAFEDFVRAHRRVSGRFNRAPAVPDLSRSQYLLLEPLLDDGTAISVGELAESAGVSAPTATRMLDSLSQRDIVTREQRAADRRIVLIDLTARGLELMEAKREHILATRAAIYAQLTPDERRGAARLLERLAAAVEELRP
jgi:DNA-binding MarR family transcriptional regulator